MNLVLLISIVANKVNDSLAKFAPLEGRTMTWIGSGPSVATELSTIDCMNYSS